MLTEKLREDEQRRIDEAIRLLASLDIESSAHIRVLLPVLLMPDIQFSELLTALYRHLRDVRRLLAAADVVGPEPEVARRRKRSPRHKRKPDQLRLWESELKP